MILKYDIIVEREAFEKNCQRLTNQLWKLLPMRENKENWEKQLETVINEVAGLNELMLHSAPQLLQILSKLEGLNIQSSSFEFYRKTIFEAINLLQEIKNEC